jgi:hypothetical protein
MNQITPQRQAVDFESAREWAKWVGYAPIAEAVGRNSRAISENFARAEKFPASWWLNIEVFCEANGYGKPPKHWFTFLPVRKQALKRAASA